LRSLILTAQNLAVLQAGGHPLYLVRTPDAAEWAYDSPILVEGLPGLVFKRHLLMYANKGHREALELAVFRGHAPSRAELLGRTLVQRG
jgi:hypothetical protein